MKSWYLPSSLINEEDLTSYSSRKNYPNSVIKETMWNFFIQIAYSSSHNRDYFSLNYVPYTIFCDPEDARMDNTCLQNVYHFV